MRLYSKAFQQGIARIFNLPRLSLPLITTLGLTLAAVLTVIAVANTLLYQPLADIDENDLYRIELNLAFNEDLTVPFFSEPRRIAAIKKLYGDDLAWGNIASDTVPIELGGNEVQVTRFNATAGSPELLGLSLLNGQGSDIDNVEDGIWISKALWQSMFGGAEDLSQQILRLDGTEYPIFGVFDNLTSLNSVNLSEQSSEQIWQFQNLQATLESPDAVVLNLGPITFVRGDKSALPTPEDLESWFVDYVNAEISNDRARDFLLSKAVTGEVVSYRDSFIGDSRQLVFVLMFAMFSLLVMASLNLLNMFIAHYQSRNKEFAIQMCMGSTLGRLRGLIFTENLPMFLLATTLGLIAAGWLIQSLPTLAGDNLPLVEQISLSTSSVLIALALIGMINFIFAMVALIYVDKTALTDSLNSSGKGTPAQQNQLVSKALMIVQLTLACVLLTGASISVKDSFNSAYANLGYSMPNAFEVSMAIGDETWQTSLAEYEQYRGSEWQQLRANLVERLSNLGGDVIDINALPLSGNVSMSAFPDPDTGDSVMIRPQMWAEGLLAKFDIELLAGRDLNETDIDLPHVLISRSFAIDRAGNEPWQAMIGKELKMGTDTEDIFKVVGIVEDTIPLPGGTLNIDAPEVYYSNPSRIVLNRLSAVVIMPDAQELQREEVEQLLVGMDSRLSDVQVDSMQQRWNTVTAATRLNMYVVMGLAALTLALAAIGVSGLSQMTASQKRYELAVCMATGAKQSRLLRLLLQDSIWMLAFGLGLGVLAAVTSYQYLLTFFNSAPAFDWMVTSLINLALAIVMILSVALPGWLVIRKDPMRVLREL
ncbi:FtsX-like permease family protein [Thalassotalea euphylliae]|uniref:ABC3 transporter permease C-terminal domain-containing protein n=1 Tax=Thalassotalea euphylliae TaxID=1655234 RepID=A0A3E0UKE9_9GAMM|nr:FtsX-like permease family protein [Thalassotalea euphylliae]REL37127.1 hypothetical protein DXX92_18415 [Thalassotalea euphylliae]